MNPFHVLSDVQDAYRTYVHTFQQFRNPQIEEWVGERIDEGTLLWRDPFVQLDRRFERGAELSDLVEEGHIHPDTPKCFTTEAGDRQAEPIRPYKHQSEAIRSIQTGNNTIVATGTGSGKSFAFGIPIVSECLRAREQGTTGIKAVIVYPMNALANSQYDDFARRLQGSGLKLARYTGDTFEREEEALQAFREVTGREQPFDSEVISRQQIKESPPDILMTNYVMLELLLTRFEDRVLFPSEDEGILQYLVLDEVHTYTGNRGSDVACLIRRLKQHTGTTGELRCIATSATVQSGEEEDPKKLISDFATKLFGETFDRDHVIGETHLPTYGQGDGDLAPSIEVTDEMIEGFDGDEGQVTTIAEALLGRELGPDEKKGEALGEALSRQATLYFLEEKLGEGTRSLPDIVEEYQEAYRPGASRQDALRELTAALLVGSAPMVRRNGTDELDSRLIPKLHAFFSQGRGITTCLTREGPHLNDRGERVCPTCKEQHGRERIALPLNFCRACGQEYYGVSVLEDGTVLPRDLGSEEGEGAPAYIYPEHHDFQATPIPDNWLTKAGNVKSKYSDAVPENTTYCPKCNQLGAGCEHPQIDVAVIQVPFLLCSECSIVHTRRPREFNKLFTFGTVGRSTATDVLVSNKLTSAPKDERKVIAFSDNRQDTALQAAHFNNLQRRLHFRRAVYRALQDARRPQRLGDMGLKIFDAMEEANALPPYQQETGRFRSSRGGEEKYQQYLEFALLQDLERTSRRIHQNLEDTGLLEVTYDGLNQLAAASDIWRDVPLLQEVSEDIRYDYLRGFLDIMRKRLAIRHSDLLRFQRFKREVLAELNEEVFIEDIDWLNPTGFSDEANTDAYRADVRRFVHPSTTVVAWTRRALNVDYGQSEEIIPAVVDTLASGDVRFLEREHIQYAGDLYMLPADLLQLSVTGESTHQVCPECGTVHHFRSLEVCTEKSCDQIETGVDLSENYFRREYKRDLEDVVRVQAAEHSGQVPGQERRQTEENFRDPDDDLNVIVCTPTMELGIDIGDLSTVYMRNVPPSPSNYAQRAGRAGRKGQPSLITVFCGAGSYRGPHDQYFYRNPEKIIAGEISPPRFLLDNERLIKTHIHSLVLEALAHKAEVKLPPRPAQILDIDTEGYPMFEDLQREFEEAVSTYRGEIEEAVQTAFSREMERFDWLTESFIRDTIQQFPLALDRTFESWREEYSDLVQELREINRIIEREGGDYSQRMRYGVIGDRLDSMRSGEGEFYTYRYLGSQGFLPNYAFPRDSVSTTFYDKDDKLSRDPVLALREYAPGNFIYYSGNRYEVVYGRPQTRGDDALAFEKLLVCPECNTAYLGEDSVKRAACQYCETSLKGTHANEKALPMPDMVAQPRASITADEEERMRKGYEMEIHYQLSRAAESYAVSDGEEDAFTLTYEHNGQVINVNRGPRQAEEDDEAMGFGYCRACNRWLVSENALDNHVGGDDEDGKCPQNARADELLRGIHLFTETQNDVITIDCPLPEGVDDVEGFYKTLRYTLEQAISVTMELDESELSGFINEIPEDPDRRRIVIYETAEGGIGAVQSLTEAPRLRAVLQSAREVLHEGEEGCEKACYECLCTFYNQRDHDVLDRTLVLPFLQELGDLEIEGRQSGSPDRLVALLEQCQSDFERQVLREISSRDLRLPDAAQKTIYDGDEPIAEADFYYEPKIPVFVDGSPHYKDYIEAADRQKRMRLKRLNYRVTVISDSGDLDSLRAKL
ncbi:hypothetical protein BSZ35_02445 [Salinibacter sp. 10B]|uniref:DEAD/DEAH box helicase n=1 Tax=Salinibacter sp. 10B TaxID=1923971 RepID=UPI000CF56F45|nr:DEAD/DEAH box helicase [Salinibacter sp. 10B]PQJ33609.1 hypothetical protein BSZ35_02445 [Salinibacter sp. 10B]